jgi:hypothetical protein
MPSIQVEQAGTAPDGWGFLVRLTEDGSLTEHRVTLARRDYERLTRGAVTPEVLVEKTFEFLLAREPKESILRQFELTVVTGYFPEFETELQQALGR